MSSRCPVGVYYEARSVGRGEEVGGVESSVNAFSVTEVARIQPHRQRCPCRGSTNGTDAVPPKQVWQ